MQLLTLDDLNRPQTELEPLIKEAQQLGNRWQQFIKHETGPYKYEIEDFGEGGRAAGVHSSELSGCFRKLVYGAAGFERKPQAHEVDVNMKMRFRIGHAVHAMLQAEMHRMAAASNGHLYFESELKIAPHLQDVAAKWDIHSHCDGVFTFCRYSWEYQQWYAYMRVGLEIKTASGPDFDKIKEPKDDHKDQTCAYQACLNAPLMWTLYYNKSNSNFTNPNAPYLFRFDAKRWATLEQRIGKAREHVHLGVLPDKQEGMPCGWCPFAWHCQPDYLKKKNMKKGSGIAVGAAMLGR
jgi:CRISPR/Cas system-associated exonuclease Cas4 (RecB family)